MSNAPRPLSSAEARAGLNETTPKLAEALARGDRAAFTALKIDEEWFTRSLEQATEREQREAYARAKAERDAKKPAARAAAREADPREYFAPEVAKVTQAIELLADVYRAANGRMPGLVAAYERAVALCAEAGEPFALPAPAKDTAESLFEGTIHTALVAAHLPEVGGCGFPVIHITPRKAGDR